MAQNGVAEVVIGAGVVGLAVARALALAGRETIILERETTIGTGTSSRNSEVMRAGIYYPKDTLKARLCVAGRKALYAYCDAHGIRLSPLRQADRGDRRRAARGARARLRQGARQWGRGCRAPLALAALELEPELSCTGALLSPSTGILDSHAFMLSLLGDAQANGAAIAFGSSVSGGRIEEHGLVIEVASEGEVTRLDHGFS